MTPARKWLVLGRGGLGLVEKSMGGNTSIHGNGTMGGRGESKDFIFIFLLKNDAFVLPRERKSKDDERERQRERERKHSSEHL